MKTHISVCVCTYKRPAMLRNLLRELRNLELGDLCTYSVVVVDNDHEESAREIVEESKRESEHIIKYCVQPNRNIALARNMAAQHAVGDFVAFIDDDEIPGKDWLLKLFRIQVEHKADGVLGPVRPKFEGTPPQWILRGRIFERPEFKTGTRLHWKHTRTGNVLLGRHLLENNQPFDPDFAVGGEDVNFFKERMDRGYVFVWCNEAPVYEYVPTNRCKVSYHINRAFLQGNVSSRYNKTMNRFQDKLRTCLKSLVAIMVYIAVLPFTILGGFHVFMKYLIKGTHHLSRLLGLFGLIVVKTRNI